MPLQIGYLNFWDVFKFIFRQIRMIFIHNVMVAEKNNNIQISKCKNDKPWKN